MPTPETQVTFLDLLNRYSNLILIVVTGVYVVLTWRMVLEMRRAREAESEAHLVAMLVPLGPLAVKLCIHNAGAGPAFSIRAEFQVIPSGNTTAKIWLHPALLSQASEYFFLPGNEVELKTLAAKYEKIIVNLEWSNTFGHKQKSHCEIVFQEYIEGWYDIGLMIQPDELPEQFEKMTKELSRIREALEAPERERKNREFMEYARYKRTVRYRISRRVKTWVQGIQKKILAYRKK
jgi:hypothetical protein